MNLPNLQSPVIRTYKSWVTSTISQITAQAVQECWSAKKCSKGTGHVLSNRDYHNCCTKSNGTSWSDRNGNCKRC